MSRLRYRSSSLLTRAALRPDKPDEWDRTTSAGANMKLASLTIAGGLVLGAGIVLASHSAPTPAPTASDPQAQAPTESTASVSPYNALKRLVE